MNIPDTEGGMMESDSEEVSIIPPPEPEMTSVNEDQSVPSEPKRWRYRKSHSQDDIIGDINSGVRTRCSLQNLCAFESFLSTIEPSNIKVALTNSDWINAMQDELHQFERNKVCHLVE